MKSAAVVIGVDRTGGLTPLKAAASGAKDVAAWLEQSGYEVSCLTDAPDPDGTARVVTRKEIFDAVSAYVGRDNLDKLIVYFAGHGYLRSPSEIWLLSGAPDDPSEAVDQTASAEMARASNIPNVVFISDCCRSVAGNLLRQRVTGATIFPNRGSGRVVTEIDHFFATRPGTAAAEAELPEWAKASGLFTRVLTTSHRDPPVDKLLAVGNQQAVPSRWLRAVLPDRVDQEAQRTSLTLTQRADIRLETEQAFLAFAQFTSAPPDDPDLEEESWTGLMADLTDFSFVRFNRSFAGRRPLGSKPRKWKDVAPKPPTPPPEMLEFEHLIREGASESDLSAIAERLDDLRDQPPPDERLANKGIPVWIAVEGTSIGRTASSGGTGGATLTDHSGARLVGISLEKGRRACSVAVEFANGSGTVVLGLRDYVCRIRVGEAGVEEISYAPFAGPNLAPYRGLHQPIEAMRAVANAAAARGLLRLDRKNAYQLARATRRYKVFDPALGMIASLAYAAAGLRDQAGSVRQYSLSDLAVEQFDIWLLAGAPAPRAPIHPFCPMMTQSWSYLDAREVKIHPLLRSAGRHSSFWTTFSAGEMDKIVTLVAEGKLK
jgi:hypothetical protein